MSQEKWGTLRATAVHVVVPGAAHLGMAVAVVAPAATAGALPGEECDPSLPSSPQLCSAICCCSIVVCWGLLVLQLRCLASSCLIRIPAAGHQFVAAWFCAQVLIWSVHCGSGWALDWACGCSMIVIIIMMVIIVRTVWGWHTTEHVCASVLVHAQPKSVSGVPTIVPAVPAARAAAIRAPRPAAPVPARPCAARIRGHRPRAAPTPARHHPAGSPHPRCAGSPARLCGGTAPHPHASAPAPLEPCTCTAATSPWDGRLRQ